MSTSTFIRLKTSRVAISNSSGSPASMVPWRPPPLIAPRVSDAKVFSGLNGPGRMRTMTPGSSSKSTIRGSWPGAVCGYPKPPSGRGMTAPDESWWRN